MEKSLKTERTVLITGSNGSLGQALVESFLSEGYFVYAHARTQTDKFSEFLSQLEAAYPSMLTPIFFDLQDPDSMKEAVRSNFSRKQRLSCLINNAAIANGGFFQATPLSKIKEDFDINFFSPIFLIQLLLRNLKEARGVVINIGSIFSNGSFKGTTAYATSKSALMTFTKILSKEIPEIRANGVCPGIIDNPMGRKMDPELYNEIIKSTSLNRPATTTEIAILVTFLCSSKASYINGQIINVDGGF